MAYSDSGGAPSASRIRVLIGVTCETTNTVRRAYRSSNAWRAASTRTATASKDSPPGGATAVEASQARCSAGQRSRTSAKL